MGSMLRLVEQRVLLALVRPVFLLCGFVSVGSLALAPLAAWAVPLTWAIDSGQSAISLAVPDQAVSLDGTNATIRLRNQSGGNSGPWNVGNSAAVGGTIATNYVDGASIQFLGGLGDVYGLTSGNYRPNPAAFDPGATNAENPDGQFSNTTSAAGVFGARVRASVSILTVDAAFFNFLDVLYDLDSVVLGVTGTSFAANTLSFGFAETVVAFDGLSVILIGQPIPDASGTVIEDVYGTNAALLGAITSPDPLGDPTLRQLTLPINVPLSLLLEGVALNASVSGQIVAFANVVPEPSTLALFLLGALGLMRAGRPSR